MKYCVVSVTEDDIGDPDDLDSGDSSHHTGVHYPGHSAKDLGKLMCEWSCSLSL